jgi:hypothetical protein
MIRQKLFLCRVKEDPEQRECLATRFYADRYEVLWYGMWRQYFEHELENIRPARLVEGADTAQASGG